MPHIRVRAALILLSAALYVGAAHGANTPESVASYAITSELDVAKRSISGRAVLTWKNTSRLPVREIYLHLYMNAFRNNRTLFMEGSDDFAASLVRPGGIDLISAGVEGAAVQLEYRLTDGSESKDRTVARLELPREVPPGGAVVVDLEFRTKLPSCVMRAGFVRDFFMIAQWYPKAGVLTEDGTWVCDPYYPFGEFFADFGEYDVTVRLPSQFETVASGKLVSRESRDSTAVVRYRATGVTDFAIAAQPDARIETFRWVSGSGRGIDLVLFMQPSHARFADRHRAAIIASLELLEDWCGPYPYDTLTLVDPPWDAAESAGGMEYPTLFTTATPLLESDSSFEIIEKTTVHETVHQYFQGILATNEVAEPWMDEGLTSYLTSKIMDTRYGPSEPYLRLFGIPPGWVFPMPRMYSWETERLGWVLSGEHERSATRPSWEFDSNVDYASQVYARTELVLKGLEREIGAAKMKEVFGRYYAEQAYRHPTYADFLEVVRNVAGGSAVEFLQKFLGECPDPRYRVDGVTAASTGTSARIDLSRRKCAEHPVRVVVLNDEGTHLEHIWSERGNRRQLRTDGRPVSVHVGRSGAALLDANPLDDSWSRDGDPSAAWSLSKLICLLAQALLSP